MVDTVFYNAQDFNFVDTDNLKVGTLTYPNRDGLDGQSIVTNGKGKLSFATISGGGNVNGPNSSVNNSIPLFNGTTGALLKGSTGTINGSGQLTVASIIAGGLAYPTSDGTNGQVLKTNGSGLLSWVSLPSTTQNRLLGLQNASVSSDISANDHIKFNQVLGSSGSAISLDTSSAYSNANNTASIGRITLQGGQSYTLRATIQGLTLGSSGGSLTFGWYNADSGTAVSNASNGTILGTIGLNGVNSATAIAWVSPSSNTRYELRILTVASLSAIGSVTLEVF